VRHSSDIFANLYQNLPSLTTNNISGFRHLCRIFHLFNILGYFPGKRNGIIPGLAGRTGKSFVRIFVESTVTEC
jgi:hypothetical protein